MQRRHLIVPVAALAAGLLVGCGSDDDAQQQLNDAIDDAQQQFDEAADEVEDAMDEFADEMSDALGAGGGGTLVVDGEEIPIESAVCQLGDDTYDVGTVSESGYRVFVSKTNPANDASVQILDPEMIQWFPQDVTGDEATRDGSTFTAGPYTFFNNQNDVTIEASVTVECP